MYTVHVVHQIKRMPVDVRILSDRLSINSQFDEKSTNIWHEVVIIVRSPAMNIFILYLFATPSVPNYKSFWLF
jgi:hypothetical protein